MSAAAKTAVVCDTTGYVSSDLIESLDLHLVSLYVKLGEEQRRESEITDLDAFYESLRTADGMPTTSQPSVGDFITVYEPLLAAGLEIVSIHLSAAISGTFETANQAKERLTEEGKGGERIRVLDSERAAGGLALITIAAGRAAQAGGDGEAVLSQALQARASVKMWFAVDTLEYFRRGGRIGGASAWVGSTLKIKPILTLDREITPVEKVRTRARAFERMLEYARERHADGCDAWVVQHIQAPENAAALVEGCREIFGTEPVLVSELGPVLGSHTGPGMLGVGAMSAEALG